MEHQLQAGEFLMNRNGFICVEVLTRKMENIAQRLQEKVNSLQKMRRLRLRKREGISILQHTHGLKLFEMMELCKVHGNAKSSR